MRFSIAAIAALAAGAVATTTPAFKTEVVTDYTTWCPEATAVTHGTQTYSVSKPTSLTLSNGPYTVTRPLLSKTVTYCNKCAGPTAPAGSYTPSVAPVYPNSTVAVVPSGTPGTPAPSKPASSSTPAAPAFTGAASRHVAGAGAGLTAVLGLVAYLL